MRFPCSLAAGLVAFACATEPPAPEATPFIPEVIAAGSGEVYRGSFSPDGNAFYFFRKVTEGAEDYRIYRTTRTNGAWLPAEMLPLGDPDASSMYPAVSPDGARLVFASYRGSPEGEENANLWMARRDGDGWGEPELLPISTLPNYDASPWFAPDGALHFTSTSPDWSTSRFLRAPATADGYGPVEEDPLWPELAESLEDRMLWSGVVSRDGNTLIAEVSQLDADGRPGPADLWISHRDGPDWTPLEPIPGNINTDVTENFPAFTADGTRLVFIREFREFFEMPVVGR